MSDRILDLSLGRVKSKFRSRVSDMIERNKMQSQTLQKLRNKVKKKTICAATQEKSLNLLYCDGENLLFKTLIPHKGTADNPTIIPTFQKKGPLRTKLRSVRPKGSR